MDARDDPLPFLFKRKTQIKFVVQNAVGLDGIAEYNQRAVIAVLEAIKLKA